MTAAYRVYKKLVCCAEYPDTVLLILPVQHIYSQSYNESSRFGVSLLLIGLLHRLIWYTVLQASLAFLLLKLLSAPVISYTA